MTIRASRTRFVWTPILGWVLLSCAATAVHAQVDTPSPARQTLDQQTPQVDLPDASSSTGGATERGDELASASARSRCFRRSTSISDMTTTSSRRPRRRPLRRSPSIRPSLELRSEWLNHSLRLLANGGFGYYASAPTQNFQNYIIQADGRLDIRTDFYATGLIAFRRSTEALGTPERFVRPGADGGRFRADRAVALSEVQSALLPAHRFGDEILVLRLQHDHARSDCRRQAATAPSTKKGSSIGYEVSDNLSVFIAPGINQRVYVDTVNAAGQQRDSTGWNIGVGASLALGPKSSLEGSVGCDQPDLYRRRNVDVGHHILSQRHMERLRAADRAAGADAHHQRIGAGQLPELRVDRRRHRLHLRHSLSVEGGRRHLLQYRRLHAGARRRRRQSADGLLSSRRRSGFSTRFVRSTRSGRCTSTPKAGRPTSPAGGPQYSRNFFSIRLVARR